MESGGERIRSSDDKVDVAEELIEALTAAGNYLAVLENNIRREPGSTPPSLAEAIEKGMTQLARAGDAAHRLHALLSREIRPSAG